MQPTDKEIDDVLNRLQRTKMEIVDEWMSDAARQGLPVVNVRDTGAPLLRTDDVLKWEPEHLGRLK